MIEVRNLTKCYGRVLAVDNISFDVATGQVVGFLGPNGAGKSTTLRILTCYLPATSGRASIDGLDVLADSLAVRRKIGYMPESVPLPGEMRAGEYLMYRAALRDIPARERRAAVDRAAEQCWLSQPEDMTRRRLDQLSRGYRQRVGLADVLLHDPPVLVLDEPMIGLDPAQIRSMRELITALGSDHTVILSSHILAEVEQICSRLVIIAGGKIAATGTPAELRRRVTGPSRIIAEMKGAAPEQLVAAAGALTGVGGVAHAPAGSWTRLTIDADGENDPRSALAAMAAEKGYPIRELRREVASLEEFFVQITYEQNVQAGDRLRPRQGCSHRRGDEPAGKRPVVHQPGHPPRAPSAGHAAMRDPPPIRRPGSQSDRTVKNLRGLFAIQFIDPQTQFRPIEAPNTQFPSVGRPACEQTPRSRRCRPTRNTRT